MRNFITSGVLAALVSASAAAMPLYHNNFEVDTTANWTLNNGPSDAAADYFFDYSTVGIPVSPSTPMGGGTRGMKLQANLSNGIFGGMSVSPNGLDVPATYPDYTVRFDWWSNINGPFPGGGSGSTNLSTFGVGTNGTTPQWPGGSQNSVWFAATGDGGSAADYRAYSTAAPTSYASGNAVYAAPAGAINNTAAYYSGFGGVAAPAAQLGLFPQQTGTTQVGSAGMQWHEVEIEKLANLVTWRVDGLLIATIDLNTVTLSGGNIFFGHSDINATSSTDPNDAALLFTLIDNVRVTPEPTSLALLGLVALAARRRGR
ncbi:MAG: PEP-CTERM sorting domain-containing protein [Phycisphaerales bacterium]|nr:PEP-CTERM sorting domain-containing protein [Phycisphaerales bacterium]